MQIAHLPGYKGMRCIIDHPYVQRSSGLAGGVDFSVMAQMLPGCSPAFWEHVLKPSGTLPVSEASATRRYERLAAAWACPGHSAKEHSDATLRLLSLRSAGVPEMRS